MMPLLVRTTCLLSAVALLGSLVACGGGGGDVVQPPPPVAQRVVLTTANAPTVAAEALQAAAVGGASAGGVAGPTAAPSTAPLAAATKALTALKQTRLQATSSQTFSCTGGGSFTVTVTVAGSQLAAGDTIGIVFAACKEGIAIANGSLSLRVVSISGTASNPLVTFDVSAQDFDSTVGPLSERTNGTLRITVDDTSDAVSVVTATSDRISTERRVNGTLRASRVLSALNLRESIVAATGQSTGTVALIASGTFPRLGPDAVSFQVETLQPIVTNEGAAHPSAGQIKVTAANNASIVATVLATGLRLEIDRDGNGTIDETRELTWAQVDAELE